MKLIYLSQVRLPTRKAHGIQIMKMCEAFALQGVKMELVIPDWPPPISGNPFGFYDVERLFEIKRLSVFYLTRFGRVGFWLQTVLFSIAASRYARINTSDLVYSRDPLPLFFLSYLGTKNLVWEIHAAGGILWRSTVRFLGPRMTRVVVISHGLKEFLVNRCRVRSDQIIVAPDGVDLRQFDLRDQKHNRSSLGLPFDKKIVGYVGRLKTMGEDKGVAALIRVFAELQRRRPDVFLMLVGVHRGELPLVTAWLGDAGVAGRSFKVVEHVPFWMVAAYLMTADVLVMNYPPTEHHLNFMSPLKMFEYMASGRPIISPDLPAVREILNENNAFLFEAGNNQALLDTLVRAIEDRVLSEKISKQALQDVQLHSWSARADKILTALNG